METATQQYDYQKNPLAWPVDELYRSLRCWYEREEIDLLNLRELAGCLDKDFGEGGIELAQKIRRFVDNEAGNLDLCPHCLTRLMPGRFRGFMDEAHGARFCYYEPTALVCPECEGGER